MFDESQAGIIPARAGFTVRSGRPARGPADHPRSRGVYPPLRSLRFGLGGSSPLARGLRLSVRDLRVMDRIIPARAGFTCSAATSAAAPADHPRSRGVYPPRRRRRACGRGSSPLARGLRLGAVEDVEVEGIIPARAGFTGSACTPSLGAGDHPRARGVYWSPPGQPAATPGSSPLARGLREGLCPVGVGQRIIPARAGFTRRSACPPARTGDHPRSRGVYPSEAPSDPGRPGSSPLARGLQGPRGDRRVHRRIIPARAGFTPAARPCGRGPADHPRSRGVYQNEEVDRWVKTGSSPLARGLPHQAGGRRTPARIIPARAGFTVAGALAVGRDADHPRSRGVYRVDHVPDESFAGSSPLARGLLFRSRTHVWPPRIIPARAGFTTQLSEPVTLSTDHPRSRGVYSISPGTTSASTGSSPLARGLHARLRVPGRRRRIIPARAGFTKPSYSGSAPSQDHPRSRGVYMSPETPRL